jgi:hypothetical protein
MVEVASDESVHPVVDIRPGEIRALALATLDSDLREPQPVR